jgi:hypothetical protein
MEKNSSKNVQSEQKTETRAPRESFSVNEGDKQPLVVSEFERAPLTDINFGF